MGAVTALIRDLEEGDREWRRGVLARWWGSTALVSRGRVHAGDELPGAVAIVGGERTGVVLWRRDGGELEVVLLHALVPREGLGTALLAEALRRAGAAGDRRLWLITTNDNTPAIEFYRKRGMRLVAVHRGAMRLSRRLKPEIPEAGIGGVPIEDELEFEIALAETGRWG